MVRTLTFSRLLVLFVLVALVGLPAAAAPAVAPAAAGAASSPDLGTAADYSLIAGTTATNTGASSMPFSVGVASTFVPAGWTLATIGPPGTLQANTPSAYTAFDDAALAYTALGDPLGADCDATYGAIDLIGMTFLPGVYCFTSTAAVSGLFTLDAQNAPSAVWIFRMGTTLTIAAGGDMQIINGGCADNVWWKTGTTVGFGAAGHLKGNILAGTTFTMGDGASLDGRGFAKETVTLTNNPITAPGCASVATQAVDGTVYIDLNDDGLYTSSAIDFPLANVSVAITDSLGTPYTVLTDASGYFTQTVAAGSTVVDVDNAGLPSNVTPTTDVNNEGSDPTTVVVLAGGVATDNTGYVSTLVYTLDYAVSKTLNSINPMRNGEPISFTISITNTGTVTLTTVPLTDTYNTNYMTYVGSAINAEDQINDGTINWGDLTQSGAKGFGIDLAAGQSFSFSITFVGRADTTALAAQSPCTVFGHTCNVATVSGAKYDLDGAGGMPEQGPLPPKEAWDDVQITVSTGVDVVDATASAQAYGVSLGWRTQNETNIVGFNVVRVGVDGRQTRNRELILAQASGQAMGSAYRFIDGEALSGASYDYLLEIVHTDNDPAEMPLGQVTAFWHIFMSRVAR